jgi:hypothetical protein
MFYLLSPEAYLLTLLSTGPAFFLLTSIKKKRGAVRARGRESGPSGGSDRPDLIFWLLLDQAKSNSLSGN